MSDALLELLAARRGIVAAVGAGGKKTTLYRLARAHRGRVALAATVAMAPFPADFKDASMVGSADELRAGIAALAARARVVAYAAPSAKPDRLGGVDPAVVTELHAAAGFEASFVKADGARMRWIKAPRCGEPLIPPGATTVLPIVSAKAIGRPLTPEIGHRLEWLAKVTGLAQGDSITPDHVARLLASPNGALQGVGDATVVPILNMVEDQATAERAREAAKAALALTERFDRVVLAAMAEDEPIVEVVSR